MGRGQHAMVVEGMVLWHTRGLMLTLAEKKREEIGKRSKRLLSTGNIPAVVYGPKAPATPITLELVAFTKMLRDAGESSVIELTGLGESLQVLIMER